MIVVVVVISKVAQHLMQLSAAGERGESTFYDSTTTTAEGLGAGHNRPCDCGADHYYYASGCKRV